MITSCSRGLIGPFMPEVSAQVWDVSPRGGVSADRGMGRGYRQALLCCWTFPPTIGPAVLVTLSRVNMNWSRPAPGSALSYAVTLYVCPGCPSTEAGPSQVPPLPFGV